MRGGLEGDSFVRFPGRPLKPQIPYPMYIHKSSFAVAGVAGLILGAAVPRDSHAQTVTVLESFEDGLDAVTVVGGGNRGEEDIDLSLHTKAGDDDLAVTDGEKALQITIKNNLAWNADADITLSQEASDLVKQAWASKEEARYLLRFDVTFPEDGYNWGNFQLRVAGFDYAQVESAGPNAGRMSIPLDLVPNDLVAEDQIVLRIVDQYGAADGVTELTLFLDNIRLVDTYAPGAVPEVTLLNGFETQEDLDQLIQVSDRYEASLHQKEGADDLAVTQGESSLEYTINDRGNWVRDFTIPFKGTLMEQIALVPQEDRWRYTLRMDVIFEEAGGANWDGNWQNFVPRQAGGAAQHYAMHRGGGDQHVRTYSATLDQFALEPGDPNNPDDPNPGVSITNQGAWNEMGMTMHIDNVRVIDTGKAPLKVQDLALNEAGNVEITWASSPSQAYGLQTSSDLQEWTELVRGVAGEPGAQVTRYVDAAATLEGQTHYRVFVSGSAPPLNENFENGLGEWSVVTREGATPWEVGEPSNGPASAYGGTGVAGTDLDANYADGSFVSLRSPVVNLGPFLENPRLNLRYFLDIDADAAVRINVTETDGTIIEEGTEENGLFFLGPIQTDDWTELDVEIPVRGQKVLLEFDIVDAGGDSTNGAGFFIDDVFIAAPEQ